MSTLLTFAVLALIGVHLRWSWSRHRHRLPTRVVVTDGALGVGFLVLLLEGSRFWIDLAWWRGLGQQATFWELLRVRWLPLAAGMVLAALVLMAAFRWGRRRARGAFAKTPLFSAVGHLVAAGVGAFATLDLLDPWKVALFFAARSTGLYHDPIFHQDLAFYLFRLPFYEMLFVWLAALALIGVVIVGLTAVAGSSMEGIEALKLHLAAQMAGRRPPADPKVVTLSPAQVPLGGVVRVGAVLVLVIFAISQLFARYALLYSTHHFLYGADFVDARIGIPLLWVKFGGALGLALLVAVARRRGATRIVASAGWLPADAPRWLPPTVVGLFVLLWVGPGLVQGVVRHFYVSPNELTLERPYIVNHIHATRVGFNLEQSSHEESFHPRQTETLDLSKFPDTAENIRLWGSVPFQNNVTQLQALRPYYAFPDVDVERYRLGGQVSQVLIAPRALDTSLLPRTAQTWVNLNLQYTHGYGAVAARVSSATSEGQPKLILKNAPPESTEANLQITRPGIYFGEETDRPVFVDTTQPEFDYPRGDDNAYTTYSGAAGVHIGGVFTRVAAALQQNDTNLLLSNYFTAQTRLLIHRQIVDRIHTLAPFLTLDPDPYLVRDGRGHLVWMVDAYTRSRRHPYAEPLEVLGQATNYIRNSVKITVDAYDGTVHFYVFDAKDPILATYRHLFPHLFQPRAAMPADLLAHIRYPRLLFDAQAETYRLYHMQDPQVFYNKEDQWDIAKQVVSADESRPTSPYYVMLRLPGDTQAEFVLLLPFTSHNRDNLIAWLAARCDPAHYGQVIFYRLPKEQLVYGPLQIESRVNQDPNISKDLSLWNQQGSRVLRGTTLVLPVGGTFLYVEPIYIQATQARLPELRKIVLAVGDRLVYSDNLADGMKALARPEGAEIPVAAASTPSPLPPAKASTAKANAPPPLPRTLLEAIEQHLAQYRQLTAQGRFTQAGGELQAMDDQIRAALKKSGGRDVGAARHDGPSRLGVDAR